MNHPSSLRRPAIQRLRQQAFTLIEILVALTITLIMMGAVVTLFGVMADSVADSRALIETSDRLRACRNRLQADLQGVTVSTMQPPLNPANDEGYFEVVDGRGTKLFSDAAAMSDASNNYNANSTLSLFGDCDDVLMFTTRSTGEPFVGQYATNQTMESNVAEVVYFLQQDNSNTAGKPLTFDATTTPPQQVFTLYRRQLLVVPGATGVSANLDVSLQNGTTTPNSLGDLSNPVNRYSHSGSPAVFNTPTSSSTPALRSDDVILTNVLAFDVQVWDPGAPLFATTTSPVMVLEQRDVGFKTLIGNTPAAFGSYVDLGPYLATYTPASGNPKPLFNKTVDSGSGLSAPPYRYDTWSTSIASAAGNFNGSDGLDNNGDGVVDDAAEGASGAIPPYTAPLRGVRITIRVYEPSSQQVREVTVVQDFSTR